MNKERIKYLLDNINCEVKSNTNWVEPLGLDRDTWKALLEYIQQKDKKIERLNNIINELEKWLVERIDEYKEMGLYDNADMYEYTLYTLQELKGSDKE